VAPSGVASLAVYTIEYMIRRFDWDVANREHIARHHVTPDEVEQVIMNRDSLIVKIESRKGETRTVCLGLTKKGRYLAAVYTKRGEMTRVVTAFPMNRSQRKLYGETKNQKQ
jgi:hypothetical protein